MSPEEHYAKAEELLEFAANDEYPERHFQDRDWLTARAQAHATMALFTPAVSINVRNPKSADEMVFAAARSADPSEDETEAWAQRLRASSTALRYVLGILDPHESDEWWHVWRTVYDLDECANRISSPVAPAPTETGPWKHRVNGEICVASPASGLPYTIGKFNDHGDFVWHSSSAELPEGFAPFVAAEVAS